MERSVSRMMRVGAMLSLTFLRVLMGFTVELVPNMDLPAELDEVWDVETVEETSTRTRRNGENWTTI
jgi:hypothetical protein